MINKKNYLNEKEYVDAMEKHLNSCGIKTWREVAPDCQISWMLPFKIDLIFLFENELWGVECKNISSIKSGSEFGKAIEQIEKYKDYTYLDGKEINNWCLSTPLISYCDKNLYNEVIHFIKHFIKYMYNIHLIEFEENNYEKKVGIDTYSKNSIYIKEGDKYDRFF